MPVKILMPALSPTMTEGNLATWHKKEGDSVASGDVLAEIETDKATMEVEAVDDGVLGKILVPDGSEGVKVNTVIGLILEDGEDSSALESPDATSPAASAPQPESTAAPAKAVAATADETAATPLARRMADQAGLDVGAIAGTGARGRITRADVEAAIGGRVPAATVNAGGAPSPSNGDRVFASPLARRLAAEANIELSAIAGTGPGGRIVKADVDKAKAAPPPAAKAEPPAAKPVSPAAASAASAVPAKAPAPVPVQTASGDEYDVVPLSSMRKFIAERMAHSKSTVPHFYLTVDCEIDELLKVRKRLSEGLGDTPLTVTDLVIRACALALKEVPDANAGWEGDGKMRRYRTADISVAVAIEGGLITPIVRRADTKAWPRFPRPCGISPNARGKESWRPRNTRAARSPFPTSACSASNSSTPSSTNRRAAFWRSARVSLARWLRTASSPSPPSCPARCRAITGWSTARPAPGCWGRSSA